VTGVLYAKDLLASEHVRGGEPISKYGRPALLVTPHINALELFSQFRSKRTHFAIVSSEEKKMLGVVTLDDVLEEVFGRIRDERDLEEGKPSKSSS
jgi:CBS domain containing-hemolysin-like protein